MAARFFFFSFQIQFLVLLIYLFDVIYLFIHSFTVDVFVVVWRMEEAIFLQACLAKTHSHLVIRCQRPRFKPVTEGHLVGNCSEPRPCRSALLCQTSPESEEDFLTCNCRVIISFYSDSVCADYREGGSSKGHPRGHSEACQEFQSRPFDLWLLQHSACAAWLRSPAPPRLWPPPLSLPPAFRPPCPLQ